ncbi:amidase [Erwinia typographi]|uniref:Amidase n=1 Tax=Erwinia typographi TaxID=371042 RepID=A0A0A3ZAG7_9GAMM|nr:amidase [Erwinia typographi]KGT94616.1 amidase [Erwinia typographi]
MSDLLTLSIAEAGRQVRAGQTGFVALVQACLDRERQTRGLNAWSELYAGQALALAAGYQTLLDNGVDLGPLHGIPLGLKANIAIAGREMHAGSKLLKGNVASQDATVSQRLKQAGAIILGCTNMHEFAWGGTTNNPHHGACFNPWDSARIPAGSSGGSGVAAAVRSAFATLGTDTGGSVRLPASMNGITGLRPGVGRIPTDGVFPLAWSMDTVGPLAPSSEDCALLYSVLSGEALLPMDELPHALRVGIISDYSRGGLQPDIALAFEEMLAELQRMGATLFEVEIDGLERAVDAQVIVDAAEPSAIHWPWLQRQPENYGEDVRALLLAGGSFTAVEYLQAQRYRTLLREQFNQLFRKVDAIVMPMLPFTAPLVGQETLMIGDGEESVLTGNMRFTCIPSLTAMPALSFPAGFDRQRLPVGMQLMGPDGSEQRLLQIAHHYQQRTTFHLQQPPVGRE